MKRFFAKIEDGLAIIEGDENNHLRNVLRLNVGDKIVAFNGDGKDYLCEILSVLKTKSQAKVLQTKQCEGLPKKDLTLFAGSVKREKLEIIVQKAVELGCKNLVIFESEFSTMKLKSEKLARYEKIILSASKQCERADLMKIEFASFKVMLEKFAKIKTKIFANERGGESFDFASLKKEDEIAILIGGEGGFSGKEKLAILNTKPINVSLGKRILRAETAVIVLTGLVSIICEN